MKEKFKNIWQLVKETYKEWDADDPFRQSATIAYYALFSIPGLLMVIIWTAGVFFGQDAISGRLSHEIGGIMGPQAAEGVESILANVQLKDSGWLMKIVGIGSIVFGSTTLFFQLQKSLNQIWEVEAAPENNFLKLLTDRAYSLGLIIVIAFLLLITLALSAIVSVISEWIQANFGEYMIYLIEFINFCISLGITTTLFALMYKILPDVDIRWKAVWVGAFITAILFVIGKTLLGIYFGFSDPTSSYGAAGTIIFIMLWINYTCLILFFGAEFTQVYAREHGEPIKPSSHAKWAASRILAQQRAEEDSAHG